MKIDFSPQFQMTGDPGNPIGGGGGIGSLASTAAGSTPYGALLQAAGSGVQALFGMIQQKKATKALEKLQTPTYNQSGSILDYYNKALQRYNVSPTESAMYKMQGNQIQRNLGSGITALGGRRSALSGVNRLVAGANDASLGANVAAEQQQNQRFGVLGQATGMKAGEEMKDFQYNKLAPYEKKYNLLAMKAGGGSQIANAGIQGLGNAANTFDQYSMLKKIYG